MKAGTPPAGPGPTTPPPAPATSEPVVRLGDYFLVRKLAQGGMAEIFLAKKVGVGGFEKSLVLKRMLDSLSGSPEFVGMFFDEAKLAAKLTHPNIAQIYDFGVVDGRYYIAMEHIPGEDTRAILTRCWEQRVKVPVGIALKIMIDVCAGLEYAHELEEDGKPLGIIHRDVSPSNIMVSYQGAVKLLDFGIAKATSRMSETVTGNVKGKYSFLSPEQIQGHPIDARADLFALGISFFELLTKRRPFRRDNELATIHAIVHDEIPDPRALRENLPEEVAVILRKALARDPEERYQSAALMRADLQTVLTRIAPGLGQADLVKFMLALFGRDERARKTRVPTLTDGHGVDPGLERSLTPTPVSTTPTGANAIVLSAERPAFVTHRDLAAARAADEASRSAARARRPTLLVGMAAGAAALAAAGLLLLRGGIVEVRFGDRAAPPAAAAHHASASTFAGPVPGAPKPASGAQTGAGAPAATTSTSTSTSTSGEERAPFARPTPIAAPTAPAAVQAQPAELKPLSGSALQAVVKRSQRRLEACFKTHSDLLPASEGHVGLEIAIDAAGRVVAAHAADSKIAETALGACLVAEARRIRFPRHPDRELRFSFSLLYRKGE